METSKKQKKSILTDAEYETIVSVFNRLGCRRLSMAGQVFDEKLTGDTVAFLGAVPRITAILMKYGNEHQRMAQVVEEDINALADASYSLADALADRDFYDEANAFFTAIEDHRPVMRKAGVA